MYEHAPHNYKCPFCCVIQDIEDEYVITRQSDIVFQDKDITAFISSHWWPNNPGHILIVPNEHFENIYTIPQEYLIRIGEFSQKLALAFKEVYKCDGVSTRQHNEPYGGQDVWHFHQHVFPRYKNDNLSLLDRKQTTEEERAPYAQSLREYFKKKLRMEQSD